MLFKVNFRPSFYGLKTVVPSKLSRLKLTISNKMERFCLKQAFLCIRIIAFWGFDVSISFISVHMRLLIAGFDDIT